MPPSFVRNPPPRGIRCLAAARTATTTTHRIVPPATEFRFMPSRYVNVSPAAAAAAPANAKGPPVQVLELTIPRNVDMYEFDRVNEEIARVTADDPAGRWVLDMSGSDYIGSAILGVLVNVRQRIRGGGGHLAVCCLSDALIHAMRTCSLYNLFSIAETRADAMRLVRSLR
jgi:anti-anti-sigma factor